MAHDCTVLTRSSLVLVSRNGFPFPLLQLFIAILCIFEKHFSQLPFFHRRTDFQLWVRTMDTLLHLSPDSRLWFLNLLAGDRAKEYLGYFPLHGACILRRNRSIPSSVLSYPSLALSYSFSTAVFKPRSSLSPPPSLRLANWWLCSAFTSCR